MWCFESKVELNDIKNDRNGSRLVGESIERSRSRSSSSVT